MRAYIKPKQNADTGRSGTCRHRINKCCSLTLYFTCFLGGWFYLVQTLLIKKQQQHRNITISLLVGRYGLIPPHIYLYPQESVTIRPHILTPGQTLSVVAAVDSLNKDCMPTAMTAALCPKCKHVLNDSANMFMCDSIFIIPVQHVSRLTIFASQH